MKLYDVEQSGQEGLVDVGSADIAKKPNKKSFDGFKV
jgi:hypothetical protein